MIDLTKLKKLSDWPKMRSEIDKAILGVLGEMPGERAELPVKVIDEISFPAYVRQRVNYFVEDWERVSAWLFVPEGKEELPAILCCHQEVAQGKDEPAGIDGDPLLAFAQHYAEVGYVTLAPDCITVGERVSSGLEPYNTKTFYKDHPKMSAMGKMLWDHIHAIDLLCDMKRVDAARVGVVGHSLGAYNALFLVAYDDRIQSCVASCGFTRFADDEDHQRWAGDAEFVHMPKLKDAIKKKRCPFDWEHALALAAPCPTLLIASGKDTVFSNPKSCEKAVNLARNVYRLLGAEEALEAFFHDGGHRMTAEALSLADGWFGRWL